jgi:hypothetical protein
MMVIGNDRYNLYWLFVIVIGVRWRRLVLRMTETGKCVNQVTSVIEEDIEDNIMLELGGIFFFLVIGDGLNWLKIMSVAGCK